MVIGVICFILGLATGIAIVKMVLAIYKIESVSL